MAKQSSPQLPQHFKIDVGDDVALKIGERAGGRIVRGAHLTDQLEVGRALVVLSRIARGMGGRGGSNYPVALNAELEAYPKLAAVSSQMRAAAIWCIENWADVQPMLGELNDHQRQTMGVRGLRDLVERARSDAWRAAQQPTEPRPRPITQAELLERELERHRRAAFISGLSLDLESGVYIVTNEATYEKWRQAEQEVSGKRAKLDAGEGDHDRDADRDGPL